MNIFAVNTIWKDQSGQTRQQMTLLIAPSKEEARQAHIDEISKKHPNETLIHSDVIGATPAFIKAVHEYIPLD